MPCKRTIRIKILEQQINELQQLVQSLEAQQRTLSVQHHILSGCCEVLHWLRTGNVHAGWLECKGTWMPNELLLLRDLGGQLDDSSPQQQLEAQPTSTVQEGQQQQFQKQDQHAGEDLSTVKAHVATASAAAGAQGQEGPASSSTAAAEAAGQLPLTQPMAIPGDFLGRMKYSLSQPPAKGAAEWTVQQFTDYYTASVKEAALLLVLAEQQSCDRGMPCNGSRLHPLQALQHLVMRHAHVINTILLLHTDALLNRIRLVNLSTLEPDNDPEQVGPTCAAGVCWGRVC